MSLLPQTHKSLSTKRREEPDLENPEWIIKLASLTDITCHLNTLNLQHQGKEKSQVTRGGIGRASEIIKKKLKYVLEYNVKYKILHFWNMVPDTECPALKQCVQKVSTYTCESTFSTMNSVKRKHRNRLTNAHLDCITRIAMKKYKNCMRVKEQQVHFRSSNY